MPAWIGAQSVAYVPTIPIDLGYNQPPPNFKDVVTQRLLFDPDTNGIDRSLRTYFFNVSYGRAILEPTVVNPVTVPGTRDVAPGAITLALANTSFQNACVVYPGAPFSTLDWAFWGGSPIANTNVANFCYDFLTSGVGAWAMELTHILTFFGDLYQTNDGDPGAFDNMSCACGVHPSTFTKLKLGWLDSNEIVQVEAGSTTNVTLHALGLPRPSPPGRVTAVKVPTSDPQHYFLIEARLRTGVFEAGIPSEGVVVYEIKEAVWAPVHLRTPTALGVSQSYNDYAQVTVVSAVPGGFAVQVTFPSNAVIVPDLIDLGLADAQQAARSIGLILHHTGVGVVIAQRPKAGGSVPRGTVVDVFLHAPV